MVTESKNQPHFERLKAELGRYPKIEDLFFLDFKIEIDPSKLKQVELGVKLDPRVHDIYKSFTIVEIFWFKKYLKKN